MGTIAVHGAAVATFIATVALVALAVLNLKHRRYLLYEDEIEVYEGFLNVDHYTTRYDRVTDVTLSRPLWQRLFGTGTIRLNTAGSNYSEINLTYIGNPEETYDKVRRIIRETDTVTPTEGG